MRAVMIILLFTISVWAGFPKIFSHKGDQVYSFLLTCKALEVLKTPLAKECEFFYIKGIASLDQGHYLDLRRGYMSAGDASIRKYISTIKKLLFQKKDLMKKIARDYDKAIEVKNSKAISIFYTLQNYKQPENIHRRLIDLGMTLKGKAEEKLAPYRQKYQAQIKSQALKKEIIQEKKKQDSQRIKALQKKKRQLRHEKEKAKKRDIRLRKERKLYELTCSGLTGLDAMKGESGLLRAIVVGKTKTGYVLQAQDKHRFLLLRKGFSQELKLHQSFDFEATGKRVARKVAYIYADTSGYRLRKTETLPFIMYRTAIQDICKKK